MRYTSATSTGQGSVDNAKLADMPASTVKLNNALTAGTPTDFFLGNGELLGTDSTGTIQRIDIGDGLTLTGTNLTANAPTQSQVFSVASFALVDGDDDITKEDGTKLSGVPVYTWATRPSAAANSGKYIWISDVGIAGCIMRSNGTRWFPTDAVTLQRVINSTPENRTTAGSFTGTLSIPADLLATGDKLIFNDIVKRNGTDATGPVYRIYMGTSATPASNSMIYGATISNTDGQTIGAASDAFIASSSSILTSRSLIKGGGGAANAVAVVSTLINTAAAMNIHHQLESINSGSVDLYLAEVVWRAA